jgi:hypothetical protein
VVLHATLTQFRSDQNLQIRGCTRATGTCKSHLEARVAPVVLHCPATTCQRCPSIGARGQHQDWPDCSAEPRRHQLDRLRRWQGRVGDARLEFRGTERVAGLRLERRHAATRGTRSMASYRFVGTVHMPLALAGRDSDGDVGNHLDLVVTGEVTALIAG